MYERPERYSPIPGLRARQPEQEPKWIIEQTEEAALVRRVQAKDEMAFREIVERYQAKVFSIIYGILRNQNDAEDIAQQVFAKIYFSIKNFDFRSSLLTWIYKITVNECYDYLAQKAGPQAGLRERFLRRRFAADGEFRAGHRSGAGGRSAAGAARPDTQAALEDL